MNKIDDLMQEITEQQDVAQEISEAFSQRTGFGEDFDEVGSAWRTGRVESGARGGRGAWRMERVEDGAGQLPPSTADRAP